jgi:modulator of FtsH protease HflC
VNTRLILRLLALLGVVLLTLGFLGSYYTVQETEQVILTEFGRPVGGAVTEAGVHFKVPFIQEVNVIEKEVLAWDGQRTEMPTRDKLYISVDMFARWRITQPLEYFRRLRDERSAQSRLDDILGSETRNSVAKHDLIEVIRTTKERKPASDIAKATSDAAKSAEEGTTPPASTVGVLHPIQKGRMEIEREIFLAAEAKLRQFGIELLDVRFKRINYNQSVVEKIYERMISERQQIASRFRSEGEGEAAKILGNKQHDLSVIESEAYKKVEEIRGQADAKATEIYAGAYGRSVEAKKLYEFLKTMETYKTTIDPETVLLLSTGGDAFGYLNNSSGEVR